MPKEYVHWVMAEKIQSSIRSGRVKEIISNNKYLYYLGAIAPDSAYYRLFGKSKPLFLSATERLHGKNGENTFEFLHSIVNHYNEYPSDAIWSFLLGASTHIITDSQFHPMIYYFTGVADSSKPITLKSEYRHRLFETYLDEYYIPRIPLMNNGRLSKLLSRKEIDNKSFFSLLSVLFFNDIDFPKREIFRTIKSHSIYQALFFKRIYYYILKHINLFSFINLDSFLALFYQRKPIMNIPFFNKKIEYMHPVTGERYYEKLGNIERRVVSHASKIFTLIEQSIEESVLQILKELKGPSAETGFLNSSAKEMKHFNIQDVKDLLFKMKQ